MKVTPLRKVSGSAGSPRRPPRAAEDGLSFATPSFAAELTQPHFESEGDLGWLSRTIGAIYDCALAPAGWPTVLEQIAAKFSFASAVLGIVQLSPARQQINIQYGHDDEWLAIGNRYAADAVAIWGGAERVQSYPLDEPIVASEVTRSIAIGDIAYYRDILVPRGMVEAVSVCLARESQLMGYIGFSRHVSAGEVRRGDREGLRLLAPHLRRAVTISNLFDLKDVERSMFQSVLEAMRHAVVLTDENARAVYVNPPASALLSGGRGVGLLHGVLTLGVRLAQDALEQALRLAANDPIGLAQHGIGIPVERAVGPPLLLHVMPLRRREVRGDLIQDAVAAVFIVSAESVPGGPAGAVALAYGLTPAETEVFASISRGRTLVETARALGIARSTAKTHLLRVFEKTGCRRQAELVALAARLSAPA